MQKKIILIPKSINDTFGDPFIKLFSVINEINNTPLTDEVVLDFKNNRWINPFFILPLVCLYKEQPRNITMINKSTYLENIILDDTLQISLKQISSEYIDSYSTKNYLPIVSFSAQRSDDSVRIKLIETLSKIIKKLLNPEVPFYTAINYIIDESVANIKDHSESGNGYLFAQYYPDKKYIDICIVDCGKGILKSYQDSGIMKFSDSSSAISEAINGLSTKNLPLAENRGYGIKTSRKMIVNGLGGYYSIISGDAMYIYTPKNETILVLPNSIKWKGTIVAIRMPFKDVRNFNYSLYLE